MFLSDRSKDFNGFLLIGPDSEGACPSDLCGMNGHKSLAQWLSKHECDYIRKFACNRESTTTTNARGPGLKCRKLSVNSNFPKWLRESDAENYQESQITPIGTGGISRMKLALVEHRIESDSSKFNNYVEKPKQIQHQGNLTDID